MSSSKTSRDATTSPRSRRALFDDGASALRRYLVDEAPWGYSCPLCLRLFTEVDIDQLTRDHVPSRQLPGDHVIVLTCVACNSRTGSRIQHEMLKREYAFGLASGTMFRRVRGEIEIEGVGLDVEFIHHPAGVEVAVVASPRNTDGAQKAIQDLLTSPDHPEIHVRTREGYRDAEARLGLLREGYLAAFAAFGYRYILCDELQVVRAQIDAPGANYISAYSATIIDGTPSDRRIGVVHGHGIDGALAVQVGRSLVFLPFPRAGLQIYDHIAEGGETGTLQLAPVWTWPRRPAYLFDTTPAGQHAAPA